MFNLIRRFSRKSCTRVKCAKARVQQERRGAREYFFSASIVIYIVILVFVLIPSLTILFTVNVSTVSLLQMNIAVLMQTLLQVQLMHISL